MYRNTRHWSAYAWIACLAILFSAFVPFVPHALGANAPDTVEMEVCTALGVKMISMPVSLDHPAGSGSDQLHKGMGHCGYCVFHAGAPGLPPPMTAMFVLSGGRDVYPPLYYHSSRPLFPWSLAQPRAPPFLA